MAPMRAPGSYRDYKCDSRSPCTGLYELPYNNEILVTQLPKQGPCNGDVTSQGP